MIINKIFRDRYNEELSVWLDEQAQLGAIVPSVVPAGTVTRRATHKLWLTSSNPKEKVVGSDLKSMVQCADGWRLVGADVDSQEQWLAAIFGDSFHDSRRAGATPFANMLLAGNKSEGTDLHSVVGKEVGIKRDQAKVSSSVRMFDLISQAFYLDELSGFGPFQDRIIDEVSLNKITMNGWEVKIFWLKIGT